MPTPEQIEERPRFDSRQLPATSNEYVAWIDVMGTQASLTQSLARASNFFAKIHLAALKTKPESVCLYPVMDGLYVSSKDKTQLLQFIHDFYRLHAIMFCSEVEPGHRFLIRGGLAYGPVVHGRDIQTQCADFTGNEVYRNSLLLGMPMIQAYHSEQLSPPFGLFIHESARSFCLEGEKPFAYRWHKWWRPSEDAPLLSELRVALPAYFSWALRHAVSIDYPKEKILEHKSLVRELFEIEEE